ncbi:hypothetical protein [Ahrensia sp. R2A130]|uniref:hypothetical protein n=1 Tax=Ahrensia sp. R2A130 TaxID=744979 RepID=UPI0012EAF440|nr:hypothetical protein [Ahrensia sp. R2A130]
MSEIHAFAELMRLRLKEMETNSVWLAARVGAQKGQVSRWLNAKHDISHINKKRIIDELNLTHDPRLKDVTEPTNWNPWWQLEIDKGTFKSKASPEQDSAIKSYLRGGYPSPKIVKDGMVPHTDQVERVLTSIETGNVITVLNAPIGEGVTSTLLQFLELMTREEPKTIVYWSSGGKLPDTPPPPDGKVVVVADRQYGGIKFPTWCCKIDNTDQQSLHLVLGCREKDRRWLERKLEVEVHAIPLERTRPEDADKYVGLIKKFEAFDNSDVDLKLLFSEELKGASGFGLLPAMIAATRGEALYMRYRRLVEEYEIGSHEFHTMASAVWLFDINGRIAHGRLPKFGELIAHVRRHTEAQGLAADDSESIVREFFGRLLGEVAVVGLGSYEFRHPRIAQLLFREIFGTSANKSRPQGTFRASKWAHYATFSEVGPHKQMTPNPPKLSALANNMVYLVGYDRANKISHESPKAIEDVVRYTIDQLFMEEGNVVKSDYFRYLSRGLAQLSKYYNSEDPKSVELIDESVALIEASIEKEKSPELIVYHANTLRGLPGTTRVTIGSERLTWFELCDEARKATNPENVENISIETLRIILRGTPRPGRVYPTRVFENLADNCARANFPISKKFTPDRLELLCNLSSWAASDFVGSDGIHFRVPDGDYDDQILRTNRAILYQIWKEIARLCKITASNEGEPPNSLKSHIEGVYFRWLKVEKNNPSKHLTKLQREALLSALTDQNFTSLADALPDRS